MTRKLERITFTPDTSLLGKIGMGNFTAAEAIAELVANSFDARLYLDDDLNTEPLTVEIIVETDRIVIRDNGVGMSPKVLQGALTLAKDMDSVTGNTRKRMGLFGLGMKSASSSLGKAWSIATKEADADFPIGVKFDLEKFAESQEWSEDLFEYQAGDENPLEDFEHGTAIIITNLHHKSPGLGPIFDLLGTAYTPLLETSHNVILVNNEAVLKKPYDLIPDSKVLVDRVLAANPNWRVHGWVGLDKKTHNKGDYGLQLYREGQLIELWNKDFFRAHLMTSRIMGELHLDFVPTNYHKKGFQTESAEWLAAKKELISELKPIAKASGDMAKGKNDPQRVAKALDGLKKAANMAPEIIRPETRPVRETEDVAEDMRLQVQEDGLRIGGRFIALSWTFEEYGDGEAILWSFIYDEDSASLQAVINSSSALYLSTKDPKVLGILALADSVAQYLTTQEGISSAEALAIRDEWIIKAVSK